MDNSIYKKCEVCGQTKHILEFSKSYRNRCKACVAKHTQEVRAAEKLTARIKHTGETVEVEQSGTMQISCASYMTKQGRRIPATALEFEKQIDWEQRRYEIAKAALQGILTSAVMYDGCHQSSDIVSNMAIRYADDLIAKLKKGGEK